MWCACSPGCVASSRTRWCWWETARTATRRSRKSIASSCHATSVSSARWTTSPTSCEAATCFCCRPRRSRSAWRRSKRWRVRRGAAVAAMGLGMAGNVLNDIWDQAADRLNRPGAERPLAAGRVSRGTADLCVAAGAVVGLGAAALVNGAAVLVGLAAFAVLVLYSPVLKRRDVLGNVAVALVAGLPLMYGALAVGLSPAGNCPR